MTVNASKSFYSAPRPVFVLCDLPDGINAALENKPSEILLRVNLTKK